MTIAFDTSSALPRFSQTAPRCGAGGWGDLPSVDRVELRRATASNGRTCAGPDNCSERDRWMGSVHRTDGNSPRGPARGRPHYLDTIIEDRVLWPSSSSSLRPASQTSPDGTERHNSRTRSKLATLFVRDTSSHSVSEAMASVTVVFVGLETKDVHEATVRRASPLRDVQKLLCKLFGCRFPATKADLVREGKLYDELHQKPFATCNEDGEVFEVSFHPTDTPYS